MSTSNLVVSPRTPSTPIVDQRTGQMAFEWLKFFQNTAEAINAALTILGEFNGVLGPDTSVSGKTGTVPNILQHLDSTGVIQPPGLPTPSIGALGGVQAADPAAGKFVTSIDALGVPQLGTVSYSEVSGAPTPPQNMPSSPSEWVNSYDSATGIFAKSQPAFSDISGKISTIQLPAAGGSGTVTLAALTVGGTQGSVTFTNGILTAFVDPT